jgi:branched-chain amino acid aminotransferase
MLTVYLNGDYIPQTKAKISIMDRGFLFGDAIYETIRAVNGRIVFLPAHLDRLRNSAKALNYALQEADYQFEEIIYELLKRCEIRDAYIRITVSRGEGQLGFGVSSGENLTVLVQVKEFRGPSEELYRKGVETKVAKTRRNAPEAINPQIKSTSNLNSLLGKLEAQNASILDVIMLNTDHHICEGAATNIFWRKDTLLYTAATSTGILEGVTRSLIMSLAPSLGLEICEGHFELEELLAANEVFFTSTSVEVLPVVKVGNHKIVDGAVGKYAAPLRKKLIESYHDSV